MLEALNYFILFLYGLFLFSAFFYAPRSVDGSRDLITSYNVVLVLFVLYVFLPAFISIVLDDFNFIWARNFSGPLNTLSGLCVSFYAAVMFVIFHVFFRGRRAPKHLPSGNEGQTSSDNRLGIVIALGVLFFGVALKIAVILMIGGFENILLRLSGGVRAAYNFEQLSSGMAFFLNLTFVADAAATWLVVISFMRRRGEFFYSVLLLLTLALTFATTGKRVSIVLPLIVAALAYSKYVRPIRVSALPWVVALILGAGMGSLFFRIFLPASIGNIAIDLRVVQWAQGSTLSFYFRSLEFSGFELITLSIHSADQVVQVLGGYWSALYKANLEPFLYIIPRALWSEKPTQFLDISHGVAAVVFGGGIGRNVFGIAPLFVGVAWITGGLLGVTAAFSGLGWLAAKFDTFILWRRAPSMIQILIYANLLVLIFGIFRQGTLGWIFLLALNTQFGFSIAVLCLDVASRARKVGKLVVKR